MQSNKTRVNVTALIAIRQTLSAKCLPKKIWKEYKHPVDIATLVQARKTQLAAWFIENGN